MPAQFSSASYECAPTRPGRRVRPRSARPGCPRLPHPPGSCSAGRSATPRPRPPGPSPIRWCGPDAPRPGGGAALPGAAGEYHGPTGEAAPGDPERYPGNAADALPVGADCRPHPHRAWHGRSPRAVRGPRGRAPGGSPAPNSPPFPTASTSPSSRIGPSCATPRMSSSRDTWGQREAGSHHPVSVVRAAAPRLSLRRPASLLALDPLATYAGRCRLLRLSRRGERAWPDA